MYYYYTYRKSPHTLGLITCTSKINYKVKMYALVNLSKSNSIKKHNFVRNNTNNQICPRAINM